MVILKTKRNCNRVMDLKKNIAHLLHNATECFIYSGRTRCCQRRLSPTRLSSFRAAAPDSERAWHSSSASSGPESSLLQGKIFFFMICLRYVIESLLTAFLWILIEVSFQIGWTHELLVVSHEFPLLLCLNLCVHCGFMMNLAYAANSTKICQLFRIIYSSFLLFPGDFQCWKPRLLRSVYWLKIRFFQSLATSGTRTPSLKRSTRSA